MKNNNNSYSPGVLIMFAIIAMYMYSETYRKAKKTEQYCGGCMLK